MKKEDTPQDMGALGKLTKEVCYTIDETGKYSTELSVGWEVKAKALDVAWEDIQQRVKAARERVNLGQASPLLYFMELRLMDVPIVAAYSGFWKWQVKRHLKAAIFDRLSEKKLQRYAEIFDLSLEELKTMNVHED